MATMTLPTPVTVSGNANQHTSAVGRLAIVIAINSFSLLATVFVATLQHNETLQQILEYVWPAVIGVFHAQIFFLAIWMSLGQSPGRWRLLLVSALAVLGGTSVNTILLIGPSISDLLDLPNEQFQQLLFVILPVPLLCLTAIWLFHAILAIPQSIFGIAIDFQQKQLTQSDAQGRFRLSQLLLWTFYFAVPFALLKVLIELGAAEPNFDTLLAGIPLVAALVAFLPLTLSALRPKLASYSTLVAAIWIIFILGVSLYLPEEWQGLTVHPFLFSFSALTVVANLLLLRWLGVRWLPSSLAIRKLNELPRVA